MDIEKLFYLPIFCFQIKLFRKKNCDYFHGDDLAGRCVEAVEAWQAKIRLGVEAKTEGEGHRGGKRITRKGIEDQQNKIPFLASPDCQTA